MKLKNLLKSTVSPKRTDSAHPMGARMRFRRTVLIAVLASVLLAPPLFAQTLTVRVSRGNVRAQPSKSSPIIGKINKGEVYDTEGRQGEGCNVSQVGS